MDTTDLYLARRKETQNALGSHLMVDQNKCAVFGRVLTFHLVLLVALVRHRLSLSCWGRRTFVAAGNRRYRPVLSGRRVVEQGWRGKRGSCLPTNPPGWFHPRVAYARRSAANRREGFHPHRRVFSPAAMRTDQHIEERRAGLAGRVHQDRVAPRQRGRP